MEVRERKGQRRLTAAGMLCCGAGEKEVRIRFREIAKEKGFEDQLDEEEKEMATKSEEAVKAQYIDVAASMAEHAAKAKVRR